VGIIRRAGDQDCVDVVRNLICLRYVSM
jgi:hypothetical protein